MKKQLAKGGHTTVCASLALLILLSVTVQAQPLVNKSWVQTTGLPDAINWTGSSFDSEKNLIFVGNTVTAPGNANILVTKYNADGNIAWQRVSGGAAGLNDYGVAVTVDNQNNSYVAAAMTASNGLFDFAVLKYDAQGNLQWTTTWDGNHHLHDIPTAITLDDAGNVIVVGSSISFTQQSNYAVVKYNSAGTQLWATTYDHVGLHDFPTAIEKASNDNIVVTGASANAPNSWDYATILVNGTTGQIENTRRVNVPEIGLDQPLAVARDAQNNLFITGYNEKLGNKNIQTVKLNSNFGLEWVQSYDAEGLEDLAKSIGCDALGNVYVAGHSKTTQEGTSFIVLKYDTQGNLLWNQTYKPYTHDGAQAADIRVMPNGDFYLSGTIQKGNETDFATLKYNKEGQIEWEKRFDGAGLDEVTTIKADNNGNVYVSGISEDAGGKKYTTVKYTHPQKVQSVIYAADGNPSHVANELIVKFSLSSVKPEFVNETDWTYGNAEALLSDNTITQMENVLPFTVRNNPQVQFSKIFPALKTTDTISLSRTGDKVPIPAFWSIFLMTLPAETDLENIKNQLSGLFPTVEYAHNNSIISKASVPNDTLITIHQSSLLPIAPFRQAHINVDSAWNYTTGKKYIKTGVYDDPIYWRHPDFGGTDFNKSVVKGGIDYGRLMDISLVNIPPDNHGTSCAGIIGALRNNRTGIAGVAGGNLSIRDTGTSLYSFGIFNGATLMTEATVGQSIMDGASSTRFGLHVQSHSWRGPNSVTLRNAVRFSYVNGCVFVAARGNAGRTDLNFPACYKDEWVLNVGAAGNNGQFKTRWNASIDNNWQSSYDGNVDIIAPGSSDNIHTTNVLGFRDNCFRGDSLYHCFNGTSAATPHTAGSVALMLSLHNTRNGYDNNLSPDDVENLLQKYSKDVQGTAPIDSFWADAAVLGTTRTVTYNIGYDIYNGWGFLDIGAVLRMIDTPRYKILHPTDAPLSFSKSRIQILSSVSVLDSMNGVPPNVYNNVEQWRVVENYTNNFPANIRIIDAWKRENATQGLDDVNAGELKNDPASTILFSFNASRNSVTVRGESFFYKLADGRWIPSDPDKIKKIRYSLHLEDKNITGIESLSDTNVQWMLFPNPTSGNLAIQYQLKTTPSELFVDVFDVTGRLVQHSLMPKVEQGTFNMDLSSLAQGSYIVRLTADGRFLYRKIIKI